MNLVATGVLLLYMQPLGSKLAQEARAPGRRRSSKTGRPIPGPALVRGRGAARHGLGVVGVQAAQPDPIRAPARSAPGAGRRDPRAAVRPPGVALLISSTDVSGWTWELSHGSTAEAERNRDRAHGARLLRSAPPGGRRISCPGGWRCRSTRPARARRSTAAARRRRTSASPECRAARPRTRGGAARRGGRRSRCEGPRRAKRRWPATGRRRRSTPRSRRCHRGAVLGQFFAGHGNLRRPVRGRRSIAPPRATVRAGPHGRPQAAAREAQGATRSPEVPKRAGRPGVSAVVQERAVVVTGAGQAGLATAWALARQGFDRRIGFVVLDADAAPGGAWQHRWRSLTVATTHRVRGAPHR